MIYNTHMACPQMCKETLINKPVVQFKRRHVSQAEDSGSDSQHCMRLVLDFFIPEHSRQTQTFGRILRCSKVTEPFCLPTASINKSKIAGGVISYQSYQNCNTKSGCR